MFILLISFLRQLVTILGKLVPHGRFPQTSGIIPLIKTSLIYIQLSTWKRKIDRFWGISFWSKSCLLWLLFPFMAFSVYGKKCKNTGHKFFAIISFGLLPSSRFNLHVYFRLFCQTTIIEVPSIILKEKITCENCGTQTTRNNIVRHKKRCSAGTLYCTHCPKFSTKSQSDLNYHIAKKHSAPKPDVTFKCKLCFQKFPRFYALRQHRMKINSRTRDVEVEHIVGDVEDHRLREELRSCQHFLVDSKLERARHKVFN